METDKILVELPKFLDQINLNELHEGKNVFKNEYFSIIIFKSLGKMRYYAKFNTPKLRYLYDFVITHSGPRNRFIKDGIEILENERHYSFIPMDFTSNMSKISRYEVDWNWREFA